MQKQLAMTTKGMHTSRVKRILNSKVAELGEFLRCEKTRIINHFFPFNYIVHVVLLACLIVLKNLKMGAISVIFKQ